MTEPQTIATVGEDAVLAVILEKLSKQRFPQGTLGPGDDCAVLPASWGQLVSTDMMVEDVDFRTQTFTPADMGWKIAAVNLSDIGAMGGVPRALTLNCGLPGGFSLASTADLADGVLAAILALAPQCLVVGGDLSQAPQIVLSATVMGAADGKVVTRAGAGVGDQVAVTLPLGMAYLGWKLLDSGHLQTDNSQARQAVALQRRPMPPVALGAIAAQTATAMMDVSDGLSQDAARIAKASGVTLALTTNSLAEQIDQIALGAAALGMNTTQAREFGTRAVFSGGEDFALLATFPAGAKLPAGFTKIGEVVDQSTSVHVTVDGNPVKNAGWQHFTA